jgi:flagellar hook assembly protein FlgD
MPGTVIDNFTIFDSDVNVNVGETINQITDDSYISNYPNPFKAVTNILYYLGHTGNVKIEIFDLLGRRLDTLVDEVKEKGEHTIEWFAKDEEGNNLPDGLYIAQICTDKVTTSTRLILMP